MHCAPTKPRRTLANPIAIIAAGIVLAISAIAPTASALDTKDNAALKYWRAFSLMSEETTRALSGASYSITEYTLEFGEGETVIEPDTLLVQQEATIQMLIEGSRLPGCDFSVDWHLGVETLLPELSRMRNAMRLLLLDASRELNGGDPDAAAERIAATIRMSRHVAEDPVLISALVGLAMFRSAADMAVEGERAGVWTDQGRAAIGEALTRFPGEDPFGFLNAMRGEERWVGDWMEGRLDKEWATPESFARDTANMLDLTIAAINPIGPDGQIEVVFEDDNGDGVAINALVQAANFRDGLKEEIDLYRIAVRMNTEVWNNPDATEHFEKFTQMLIDGEFGVIAPIMLPAFERSHQQDMESRRRLEELRFMFRAR